MKWICKEPINNGCQIGIEQIDDNIKKKMWQPILGQLIINKLDLRIAAIKISFSTHF